MLDPKGWHVPAGNDWSTLENYLVANRYNFDGTITGNKIAKSMSSTIGWFLADGDGAVGNDASKNNKSGFSALPAGAHSINMQVFQFVWLRIDCFNDS